MRLFNRGGPSGRYRCSWLAVTCLLFLPVPAQPGSVADTSDDMHRVVSGLQTTALQSDLAWNLLASLTTDVGPRMAGTPGDAMAVAWAQERMQALDFDRIWLEPVEFPLWQRRSESAAVVSPRRQELAVAALGGSPSTGGALRGEIAHFASLAELEVAEDAEVTGKIVFVSERLERGRSGRGYGAVVKQRSKGPFVAARKGAAALVIRSVGTDNNRLAHTGNMSGSEEGQPVPSAAISNPDADLLLAMLSKGEPVTLELALDCGYNGMATTYNVIGEFDGRLDDAGFVVVGGHLDSWDLGTGAHDDATGVAIAMSAASHVAQLPGRPRRGIRVVLFGNEEQGVYGGKAYAEKHAAELDRHVIGAESDLGGGRIYRFRTRVGDSAGPAIDQLVTLLAPLGIPREAEPPAFGGADLGQMVKLGMPAVDLDHDATLYFDYHHTANDTLDKVLPEDLRFNVAAYVTFIYFAAETQASFGPVQAEGVRSVPMAAR